MKKLFITLLALSVLFSLTCCGKKTADSSTPSQTEGYTVYEISDFTFEAPSSWTYEEIGDTFLRFDTGYVLIEWDADLCETTADDSFIENVIELISLLHDDFELTSGPTRQTIGGCEGFTYAFEFTTEDPEVPAQATAASLFADSGMLTFTLYDTDLSDLHTADFEALLTSLSRK